MPLDKFARTLGYHRIATETWNSLPADHKANLQAYSDGVNDFITNVRIGEGSAMLLPPEFYLFSLADKIEPWTPVDSLANIVLI